MPDMRNIHRVLVVAYYFPPLGLSGVQRTLKFVKYLPQFGWEPVVLTVEDRGYFAKDESLLRELDEVPVEVIRTPSMDPLHFFRKKNIVRMPSGKSLGLFGKLSQAVFIPDNKIGWKRHAVDAAMRAIERQPVDAIFATAPPYTDFLIGAELKRRTRLPLVLDYRDAWLANPLHSYITPLHRALHRHLEQRILRAADRIIAINRPIKEETLTAYPFLRHNDVQIIPQGFDQADFEGLQRNRSDDGVLRILHAGTFYYNRTPLHMLHALKTVFDEHPPLRGRIELHLAGSRREEDLRNVEALGLGDAVHMHGYLPHRDTIQQLLDADVLWLMIGRGRGEEMMSTGKLYEYLGACRTILATIPEGAARQVLAKSGGAVFAPPDDRRAIAAQLIALYELHKNHRLPAPSYAFAEQFERRILSGQLAAMFASLLEADPHGTRIRTRVAGRTTAQDHDTPTSSDAS